MYFSERDELFKVYPKHEGVLEGYVSTTVLRQFYKDAADFDQKMRDEILLTAKQTKGNSSHEIWKHFQHKFTKVGELGKYVPFFKDLTKNALVKCINQNVAIVEYRHISGTLFDDNKRKLDFLQELKVFREIVDDIRKDTPHFEFKLILTGLKIVGKKHID